MKRVHIAHPRAPVGALFIACVAAALIGFVSLPAAAAGFDGWSPSVQGSGTVQTNARAVRPFTALDLSSDARIDIRQGDVESAVVTADDNIQPLIDVHLEGSTLIVRDRRPFRSSAAAVAITVRRVDAITVGGSTDVHVDRLVAPKLALALGGSSALHIQSLTAETLSADVGGSAALKAEGLVNSIAMNVGGSCVIDFGALAAQTVVLNGGGSAQLVVRAKDSLTANLGGSAHVSYYGHPATTLSRGGSATVTHVDDR